MKPGIYGVVGSTLSTAWQEAVPDIARCGMDTLIHPGSEHPDRRELSGAL